MSNTVVSINNAYMNDYMKERWKRRRENAIRQLGGKCAECGSTDELEFDHIDPTTKLYTIAKAASFSEERFQKELAKCQLLCRVHHEQKTLKDLGQVSAKTTHGTLSSYRYCKPACELCRKAWNEYHARKKRERKAKLNN